MSHTVNYTAETADQGQSITGTPSTGTLTISGCVLDATFQTLATDEKIIRLRSKLFSTLYCLVDNQNQLVTRHQLITNYWNGNFFTGEKAVTHAICQIRKIFNQYNIQAKIITLSKQGYVCSCKK